LPTNERLIIPPPKKSNELHHGFFVEVAVGVSTNNTIAWTARGDRTEWTMMVGGRAGGEFNYIGISYQVIINETNQSVFDVDRL
jgi:hypothetical protein